MPPFPARPGASLPSVAVLCLVALAPAALAATPTGGFPDAAASDPDRLGWMQGYPPPPERVIRGTDADFFSCPRLRWTVCHFDQLMPTTRSSRGFGAPIPFERDPDPAIDGLTFEPLGGGETMTWREALAANYTDGIVVLHEGRIVYERYAGCLTERGRHGAMSVTKSLVGLLGEILVVEGVLDENARVGTLIPELAASAFGDATLRQVLDMTTGLRYSEDYADPDAEVWLYTAAASSLPKPDGYDGPRSYWEYLQTVRPEGNHGAAFAYKTINTDALGWILARATGRSVADLLSERIWSRMGAEQDAYFTVDAIGTPYAGGGLSASLRDLARIGQLMLDEGAIHGRRLFPAGVVRRIRAGGDREAFAKAGYGTLDGGSYRSMWWVFHDDHGAYAARGVHGQTIYVDPTARMVIARFASHPVAFNAAIDPTSLPAYRAVARHLLGRP